MPHKVTIYHKETGPADLYTIDARDALQRHPGEWSAKPWPADDGNGADEKKQKPAGDGDRKQSEQ